MTPPASLLEKAGTVTASVNFLTEIVVLTSHTDSFSEILTCLAQIPAAKTRLSSDISGNEAVLAEHGVLLLDGRCVGQDTFSWLDNFRKNNPRWAIVLLSGTVSASDEHNALRGLVYECRAVNDSPEVITGAVKRALENVWLTERYHSLMEKNSELIEKLHSSYFTLREEDKLKNEFLAAISHEVLTPVTCMKGLVYNLMKGILGELNEKQRRYLTAINEEIVRLKSILENMLDFSKNKAAGPRLKVVNFNVKNLLSEVSASLCSLYQEKNIQVACIVNEQDTLETDAERLRQVLVNLLDNAFKYQEANGRVLIKGEKAPGERYRIVIEDRGSGIPKEYLDKIFGFFNRSDENAAHGHGIGLALTKQLVEFLRGEITVRSGTQGSVFEVILPLKL